MELQNNDSLVIKIDLSEVPDENESIALPPIMQETIAQAPDDANAHLEKMLAICADVKYVFCEHV